MDIVVLKFGGTSVRDEGLRYHVLKHIRREVNAGYKVLVVVSAMGRLGDPYSTDTLKSLIDNHSSKREYDRLLSCGEIISSIVMSDFIQRNGLNATSISPQEVGIQTDDNYQNANILKVETDMILERFKEFDVLIAPGFVGMGTDGSLTTLGRGGSDTSAIALGGALDAVFVDIYSDVEGVMTADPKLVKDAKLLKKISYDNLICMAARGAKVIHLKAIELAEKHHVNLRLRATTKDHIGTYVAEEATETLSLTYQLDYDRYEIEEIQLPAGCPCLHKQGTSWYAKAADQEDTCRFLQKNGIPYSVKSGYVRIIWLNRQKELVEVVFFVDADKLEEMMNFLHYNLI